MEFSSNLSAIYTKWCAQTFPPILDFLKLLTAISGTLWRHLATKNENYVVLLNDQSLPKKRWIPRPNRLINGNEIRVRTMHPSNARRSGLGAWPTNKKNKHHIFAPTAGARCTIFPKICMLIELVVPIIKDVIHFSIQRIVFPTGAPKNLA